MKKKTINTICVICGNATKGELKIRDRDWCRPLEAESCACADCFKHWQDYDDKYLIEKIREKLLKSGSKNL